MFRRKGSDSDDLGRPHDSRADTASPLGANGSAVRTGPGGPAPFHPDVPHRATPNVVFATQVRPEGESKRLTVGKEISVNGGEITDCDRLVVEGTVNGRMTGGRLLEIARDGVFQGEATVENADIAGVFEGTLTVLNRLSIYASGRVKGTVIYGQLEVERGGRIEGESSHDGASHEADLLPIGDAGGTTPGRASQGS